MSANYTKAQQYRRKLDPLPPIEYVRDPRQQLQLKTLFQYVIDRDLPNIRKFRQQGYPNIFQSHEAKTGQTVLHVASYKNDLELVTFFLNEGADIDTRNRGGTTPLMVAAHHGYVDLVKLFIFKGASLEAEDRFGQNVLWYCFGGTERHAQIAALCMEAETSQTRPGSNAIGKPILVKACEKGNKATEVVQLLLRHGSDANEPATRTGRTPLIEASRRNAVPIMKILLAEGADPDALDYKQVHSAHEAAYHGHVPSLQLLAAMGAHLDAKSYNGNTPLHLAVSAQQLTSIRYLVNRGANCDEKNNLGLTPKTLCKKYNFKTAAKEMKKGAKQAASLKENKSLLVLYDWIQHNAQKLSSALDNSSDVISRDDLSGVLQSVSAPVSEENVVKFMDMLDPKKTGSISVPELLKGDKAVPKAFRALAYQAPVSKGKMGKKKQKKKRPKLNVPKGFKLPICVGMEEQTPTKFTDSPFVTRHVFPGQQVLSRPTDEKATPFSDDSIWMLENITPDSVHVNALCQRGDWDSVIRACQKGFNVNQCDQLYKTPLMYAAAAGSWDMVQMLLAYGADVKAVDNFGWSALHHACRRGQPVVVDELIQNGANVNEHTLSGGTPLMNAIESNNLDCVLCCVVNGANLKAKTVSGASIKDYAKAFGTFRIYKAISRYLKAYVGDRNIRKSLAAVDPDTQLALGNRDLVYEYGKDVQGVFRRQRFLQRKTLLDEILHANLPVRAVKPTANKAIGPAGFGAPAAEIKANSETGSSKPLPRILVTNTGKPLHVKASKAKTTKGDEGHVIPEPKHKDAKQRHSSQNGNVRSDEILHLPSSQLAVQSPSQADASPAVQDRRQNIRTFFAEANQKFDLLTGDPSVSQGYTRVISDPFNHDIREYGRSQQAEVMEFRTELERTAWMLRNHLDYDRGCDLTFYTPAADDWQPPSKEDMVLRYKIQPGLFDWTVKPTSDRDPMKKYVRKMAQQIEEESSAKHPSGPGSTEKSLSNRFSITEELKRIHKIHPLEGNFMTDDEVLPSPSLVNNFLAELKKENGSETAALAFSGDRKQTVVDTSTK